MHNSEIGRLARLLRHRAALTQEDLAKLTGLRRWKVVRLEAGDLAKLDMGDVERMLAALDARLDIRATYHGALADRLLDERHASIVAARVDLHRRHGWEPRVEVSFSDYGDRGSIDLLGWQAQTRTLVVEEIKSELGAVEGTLRPLDVKVRLAPKIARERFGWSALNVGRIMVLPEERTLRRQVERHEGVLRAALPARSRELSAWMRGPRGSIAGIWFLSDVQDLNRKRNPSAIRRVRKPRPRSDEAA
ncbi:MAG: helix-turn-helix transcriptional regulator [Chloroflexota bacterium]|nr:helix-turn-helix transcriptional regulator [Chloroflexota bacterium]